MALALASALALGACGSGSSSPSKSEYVARADAICRAARAQTLPLIRSAASSAAELLKSGSPAAAHTLAPELSRLHAIAAGDLARLQHIQQPSGDHAAIERFLRPLRSGVETVAEAGVHLSKGETEQALAGLTFLQATASQVASSARAYGLSGCEDVLSTT